MSDYKLTIPPEMMRELMSEGTVTPMGKGVLSFRTGDDGTLAIAQIVNGKVVVDFEDEIGASAVAAVIEGAAKPRGLLGGLKPKKLRDPDAPPEVPEHRPGEDGFTLNNGLSYHSPPTRQGGWDFRGGVEGDGDLKFKLQRNW
jgi:hypothetical protein